MKINPHDRVLTAKELVRVLQERIKEFGDGPIRLAMSDREGWACAMTLAMTKEGAKAYILLDAHAATLVHQRHPSVKVNDPDDPKH